MGRAAYRRAIPAIAVLTLAAGAVAQTTWHVDDDAVADGSGMSWSAPFAHLADALDAAAPGDTILVAQGVYRPDEASNHPDGNGSRSAAFVLVEGLTLLGGHAGVGEPDPGERDPAAYVTILSGDLSENDQPGGVNRGDNSHHVLRITEEDAVATLDGFTVSGGYANGGAFGRAGGGLVAIGAHPVIGSCAFVDNIAESGGAIACLDGASPEITDSLFDTNAAAIDAGGSLDGGAFACTTGTPELTRCVFLNNSAEDFGGAMALSFGGDATVVSCVFEGNSALFGGGVNANGNSSPAFHNCLFVGNDGSVTGGAARAVSASPAVFGNCTFYGNDSNFGAVLFSQNNDTTPPTVANSILVSNGDPEDQLFSPSGMIDVLYSLVEGGAGGIGNIDADPLLADPEGGDFTILPGSACIDAGTNTEVPEWLLADLAGNPRLADDPETEDTGVGPAPIVDMGAYELPAPTCAADFNGDGSLDVLDFVAFQQAFQAQDPSADCNADGEFTVLDFVCFQQLFQAGCA